MKIYSMYLLILLITIVFFIIIKDKNKALRITVIISISSSILTIVLILAVKIFLQAYITSINISIITDYLSIKFINNSLILFIIGIIELLISKSIRNRKKTST